MIDIKARKKALVTTVNALDSQLPFVFAFGVINAHAREMGVGLQDLFNKMQSDLSEMVALYYHCMSTGFAFLERENPFECVADFEALLTNEDIEAISTAFAASMPQGGEGNAQGAGKP